MRLEFIPTRDYLCNHWFNRIPFRAVRMKAFRAMGLHIGPHSTVLMTAEFNAISKITVGDHTIINQHVYLDGRGGLSIGDSVNISSHVLLVAGTHDVQDGAHFRGEARPIFIEDYVWLGTRCTILCGVRVGKGAVVAAGAVVTQDVAPFTIVGGVPARKIGDRTADLSYKLNHRLSWR